MPAKTLPNKRRRGRLVVSPELARGRAGFGYYSPADFLDLPGDVISGHRDRHVIATRMGRLAVILKKEHRVPWSVRWHNWRDGFGWVSLAEREAATLATLREADVPVPECLAHGVEGGKAFILLKRVRNARDLRRVLHSNFLDSCSRWELARSIGSAIARIHRAGYTAPNLSAKHVLIASDHREITFVDWTNARRRPVLERDDCLQTLAALHASVAPQLAAVRERLTLLRAYLRALNFRSPAAPFARHIVRLAGRMARRRSIHEQAQSPKHPGGQRLRWLDGERLCVARSLAEAWQNAPPQWLCDASQTFEPFATMTAVEARPDVAARLYQLPPARRTHRYLAKLTGRPIPSSAVRQAGLAFRLQRYGVPVLPVLAFGNRGDGGGFILVRMPHDARGLREWLALPRPGRRAMLRGLGKVLKRCHEAGCRGIRAEVLFVATPHDRPRLRLMPDGRLVAASPNAKQVADDLKTIARQLGITRRAEVARIIRGYLSGQSPSHANLQLAAAVLCLSHGGQP